MHPVDPVLPQTFRDQDRDADQHDGLGVALRPIGDGQSGRRSMDAHSLDDRLWRGLRLFQHIGFAVRQSADFVHDPFERARRVYDHDQWFRSLHRVVCSRKGS